MIYFDNGATTMVLPPIAEKVNEINLRQYGNPSSVNFMGVGIEREINSAREKLSRLLQIRPGELCFTSGGTESNNLAIWGAAQAYARDGKHMITTKVEHPSVLECFRALESEGYEVTYIDVGRDGLIDPAELMAAIRNDTTLVSVIHINNETGAITDISRLSAMIKASHPRVTFHSDGVQAFGKEQIDLNHVDLYSISSHKIHGMKGTGALLVRTGVKLKPLLYGGGQEKELRPGTENTAGIVAMGMAAEACYQNMQESQKRVREVKEILLSLTECLDNVYVNGGEYASDYILNLSFIGVKGESLVRSLGGDGIYVSTGAACHSRKKAAGQLQPLRLGKEREESAVRFSFSHLNYPDEAQVAVETVVKHVMMLRKLWRKR